LFGLILATGRVVDDAIVVIENAQRHINEDRTDPHTATSVAMAEVAGAVVATSLVLISVFIPVSFFPGTTGILYKQFSLTIAFAIAISLFNVAAEKARLAAILLRSEDKKYGIFDWTRIGWLSRGYR
jgi:HAE1 family hydrophobic/amphiphilic exporter-1